MKAMQASSIALLSLKYITIKWKQYNKQETGKNSVKQVTMIKNATTKTHHNIIYRAYVIKWRFVLMLATAKIMLFRVISFNS